MFTAKNNNVLSRNASVVLQLKKTKKNITKLNVHVSFLKKIIRHTSYAQQKNNVVNIKHLRNEAKIFLLCFTYNQ